jgi:predicted RNA-binding Zn-ribbon protein involved in translation (DUF1610 family)
MKSFRPQFYCWYCSKEIDLEWESCPFCNMPLECPDCGYLIIYSVKKSKLLCPNCGWRGRLAEDDIEYDADHYPNGKRLSPMDRFLERAEEDAKRFTGSR